MLKIKKPKLHLLVLKKHKNEYNFKGFLTYQDLYHKIVALGVYGKFFKIHGKNSPSGLSFHIWDDIADVYQMNQSSDYHKAVFDNIIKFV